MSDLIMVNGEAADVPAILASKYAHCPAAGYVTGGWPVEWSEQQFAEFARKIRVDQSADPGDDENGARALDVENGTARPADVASWLHWRALRLNHGGYSRSTVYCDLSTVPGVIEAVTGTNPSNLPSAPAAELVVPRWWLAWWWGRPGIPTRAQVLAELKRLTDVDLPADWLWACQFRSDAQWELSVVYGDPDFDRS